MNRADRIHQLRSNTGSEFTVCEAFIALEGYDMKLTQKFLTILLQLKLVEQTGPYSLKWIR